MADPPLLHHVARLPNAMLIFRAREVAAIRPAELIAALRSMTSEIPNCLADEPSFLHPLRTTTTLSFRRTPIAMFHHDESDNRSIAQRAHPERLALHLISELRNKRKSSRIVCLTHTQHSIDL